MAQKELILAAVDIGTTKIVTIVGTMDNAPIQLNGNAPSVTLHKFSRTTKVPSIIDKPVCTAIVDNIPGIIP